MDLLSGTPYLLGEPQRGNRVLAAASDLQDRVQLLRRNGTLDPTVLQRLRDAWGFQQVHESAGIEGNLLTLNETQMAIQRGMAISGKPPEHSEEVVNLYAAHRYLEELAREDSPISEREVCEIQSLIVGRGIPDSGGYRTVDVEITNSPHKPPSHLKVRENMQQLGEWLASRSSLLPVPLAASVCHAWLAHIHPFRDGNGRTARAVMNLLLIRAGFPIAIVRRKDRQRYYEALRASDDADIAMLLELVVERSDDSLRQIDHVRKAVTGLNLAMERVLEDEARVYRIWADAIGLFASTFENTAKQLESDPAFKVLVQRYDVPSTEDYQAICQRNPSGNTWLTKVQVRRGATQNALLLWIGYSSEQITSQLGLDHPIPSIRLSVPNTEPPPTWQVVNAASDFHSTAREFVYHGGEFYVLRTVAGGLPTVRPAENLVALLNEFVADLVRGWFVRQ